MESPRVRRMSERIKEILADQLQEVKDPRIGFVTLTDVRTSSDLRRAEVYYTVLPDDTDSLQATADGLSSATPMLRRVLGAQLQVRHVPELQFVHDPVPERARRLEALLEDIRPAGDAHPDDAEAADGDAG